MQTMISYVGPKFEEHDLKSCEKFISKFEQDLDVRVKIYHNIRLLLSKVTDARSEIDIICIDLEHLRDIEGVSMFDTIRTLDGLLRLNKPQAYIVGMAGHDTDPSIIRESLQIPEIRTISMRLGGPWTFEMVLADSRRYISGDYTVAPEIKHLIEPPKKKSAKSPSITLTPRQAQILDLITTRGASNKVIAKTLKISESTVKLHMSAILKKYGCRNRTQLAVFSRDRVKTVASWIMTGLMFGAVATAHIPDFDRELVTATTQTAPLSLVKYDIRDYTYEAADLANLSSVTYCTIYLEDEDDVNDRVGII